MDFLQLICLILLTRLKLDTFRFSWTVLVNLAERLAFASYGSLRKDPLFALDQFSVIFFVYSDPDLSVIR